MRISVCLYLLVVVMFSNINICQFVFKSRLVKLILFLILSSLSSSCALFDFGNKYPSYIAAEPPIYKSPYISNDNPRYYTPNSRRYINPYEFYNKYPYYPNGYVDQDYYYAPPRGFGNIESYSGMDHKH